MEEFKNGIVEVKSDLLNIKKVMDAYSNLKANLGAGSSNLSQQGKYMMERFTWDYWTLNILFRNNWIAKGIIEKPANEMLKNGFEIQTQLEPEKVNKIMQVWKKTATNDKFLLCLKWARLYGGCLLIPLITGQEDLAKPLDLDDMMPDSYKGCFLVDRWSGVSPSISLVEDIENPEFGQPEYYQVTDNTTNKTYKIHNSRVIKMIGRQLPYWEEIAETWWGASELEHAFTELRKRDDTSANIAFLIFLANIRMYKMDGLSSMLTIGDQEAAQKAYEAMQTMNTLMCNTGSLVVDKEDDFTTHQYSFSGLNEIYESFMLDIAGASEIPVDKLFGRSPTGFNSGAETLQNYYDTITEKQETYVRRPLEKLIKIITMSAIGEIPDDIELVFNPVRRPADMEKADLAEKQAAPLFEAFNNNIIDKATVLKELKQQSKNNGMWTNITDEMIEQAKADAEQEKLDKEEEEKELELAANQSVETAQKKVEENEN